MIRWSRHLDDTRIHECYFNEHGGESMDPRAADHFAECPRCADRYRELASFMDGLSAEAVWGTFGRWALARCAQRLVVRGFS